MGPRGTSFSFSLSLLEPEVKMVWKVDSTVPCTTPSSTG